MSRLLLVAGCFVLRAEINLENRSCDTVSFKHDKLSVTISLLTSSHIMMRFSDASYYIQDVYFVELVTGRNYYGFFFNVV